ncbi:MAG: hypothetical protein E6J00_14845, partial [Chloroflexi bacterium]
MGNGGQLHQPALRGASLGGPPSSTAPYPAPSPRSHAPLVPTSAYDDVFIYRCRPPRLRHHAVVPRTARVSCPEHGVVIEHVPWAAPGSGFT